MREGERKGEKRGRRMKDGGKEKEGEENRVRQDREMKKVNTHTRRKKRHGEGRWGTHIFYKHNSFKKEALWHMTRYLGNECVIMLRCVDLLADGTDPQ